MKKLKYKVTFTTPAFLGNAQQSGQWRTPPFKALLRQWWRVAVASRCGYDHEKIREEEGRLFGNAWLDSGATKSLVRIRLDQWAEGSSRWQSLDKIGYSGSQVAADLYLGYGPVEYNRNEGTRLKYRAIQAEDSAILSLAIPDDGSEIMTALGLIDRLGTLGGRSRNGWGSVSLESQPGTAVLSVDLNAFKRPLEEALSKDWDWPHAVGCDGKGLLIWEAKPSGDWKAAMTELAGLRKTLNAEFKGDRRKRLSYPVTKDNSWGNKRLPNSLRFKVVPAPGGKVKALIFHLPCLPPPAFNLKLGEMAELWRGVHQFLDKSSFNRTLS